MIERCSSGISSTDSPTVADRRVGRRIRLRRLLLQVELEHLAGDLGIPASALTRIETGEERPAPALLARIASYLGVSISWFFREFAVGSVAAEAAREQAATPSDVSAFAQPDVGAQMLDLLDQFLQADAADRQAILDFTRSRLGKQHR